MQTHENNAQTNLLICYKREIGGDPLCTVQGSTYLNCKQNIFFFNNLLGFLATQGCLEVRHCEIAGEWVCLLAAISELIKKKKKKKNEICGLQLHDIMIVSWKAFCRSLIIQRCERDGRTPGKQNIWMASWRRSYLKDCFSFFSLRWVTFALQLCDHCFFFFTMQPKKEKHCSHSVEWNRGENHLRDMSSAGRRLWSQQLITLHHLFFYMYPTRWKIHPVWSQPAWLLPPFARTVKISPQKGQGWHSFSVSSWKTSQVFIILFESAYFPPNSVCMRAHLCVASTLQSRPRADCTLNYDTIQKNVPPPGHQCS